MPSLTFSIWPHIHSRRTSYNLTDVIAAIESCGLDWSRPGFLVLTTVHNLESRKRLESALKRVHRNIAYRIEVTL